MRATRSENPILINADCTARNNTVLTYFIIVKNSQTIRENECFHTFIDETIKMYISVKRTFVRINKKIQQNFLIKHNSTNCYVTLFFKVLIN